MINLIWRTGRGYGSAAPDPKGVMGEEFSHVLGEAAKRWRGVTLGTLINTEKGKQALRTPLSLRAEAGRSFERSEGEAWWIVKQPQ
jgi:hypothetical protein